MVDVSPTRSAVIEMKDERRAMHEGYVFLDEKCLLLAGEILRQLQDHARLKAVFDARHAQALDTLAAAVARHGLEGLQVHPAADATDAAAWRVREAYALDASGDALAEPALGFAAGTSVAALFSAIPAP